MNILSLAKTTLFCVLRFLAFVSLIYFQYLNDGSVFLNPILDGVRAYPILDGGQESPPPG